VPGSQILKQAQMTIKSTSIYWNEAEQNKMMLDNIGAVLKQE